MRYPKTPRRCIAASGNRFPFLPLGFFVSGSVACFHLTLIVLSIECEKYVRIFCNSLCGSLFAADARP